MTEALNTSDKKLGNPTPIRTRTKIAIAGGVILVGLLTFLWYFPQLHAASMMAKHTTSQTYTASVDKILTYDDPLSFGTCVRFSLERKATGQRHKSVFSITLIGIAYEMSTAQAEDCIKKHSNFNPVFAPIVYSLKVFYWLALDYLQELTGWHPHG